jgi:hypothetical protein
LRVTPLACAERPRSSTAFASRKAAVTAACAADGGRPACRPSSGGLLIPGRLDHAAVAPCRAAASSLMSREACRGLPRLRHAGSARGRTPAPPEAVVGACDCNSRVSASSVTHPPLGTSSSCRMDLDACARAVTACLMDGWAPPVPLPRPRQRPSRPRQPGPALPPSPPFQARASRHDLAARSAYQLRHGNQSPISMLTSATCYFPVKNGHRELPHSF